MVWDADTGACIPANKQDTPKPTGETVEASLRISELELQTFKAEQRSKTLEEQVLNAEAKYKAELVKTIEYASKNRTLSDSVARLEASVAEKDTEKAKLYLSSKQEVLDAEKRAQDAIAESRAGSDQPM